MLFLVIRERVLVSRQKILDHLDGIRGFFMSELGNPLL